jgi:hypothetical protein
LEAARAERMRQNGHGAITIEDVRTWIEETGLAIFLPRSAQAGFTAPTFVEAVAGQRTTEPTLELIATAESLLVRLEAEGVAVRLNLAGLPGDQPDYVVAGWVLPYIYALRGDRDWRRSPQLTGSRQVSQLAVEAAKQLDTANLNAAQIRDALGRETTETAVLRALHELWKQLRIIPVVPEMSKPALWQPLRQRFQKAIAEGASTSQVTAISVLASIYLQAVIAASMEDVEMFLSPLTSRSKIREVVRGLAATRQVHSTTTGHSPMYYVAGTLPEFPTTPSYQINSSLPAYRSSGYRSSAYLSSYLDRPHEEDAYFVPEIVASGVEETLNQTVASDPVAPHTLANQAAPLSPLRKPLIRAVAANGTTPGKSAPPRPRAGRSAGAPHVRERSRSSASSGEARSGAGSDRRRAPAPRTTASNGNGSRGAAGSPAARNHNGFSNGNGHHTNGSNGAHAAQSNGASRNGAHANGANGNSLNKGGAHAKNGARAKNGAAQKPVRAVWAARAANGSAPGAGGKAAAGKGTAKASHAPVGARSSARPASRAAATANGHKNGSGNAAKGVSSNGHRSESRSESRNGSTGSRTVSKSSARPASRARVAGETTKRTPPAASAAKRYSFTGQAKQAPKQVTKGTSATKTRATAKASSSRPATAKRRG